MIAIRNNLAPGSTSVGIAVIALPDRVSNFETPDVLEQGLADFCRRVGVDEESIETNRTASRDMLRNGRFKPTGRSKPANEYLLRSVTDGAAGFPRINPIVDIANYVSLRYQIPLSLWDLDRARSDTYVFRLGRAEESYVFNPTGQAIDLQDLAVGCAVLPDAPDGFPIVNPVKDSMATKTTDATRNVGVAIYAPQSVFSREKVANLLTELLSLVSIASSTAVGHHRVLEPGDSATLEWSSPTASDG